MNTDAARTRTQNPVDLHTHSTVSDGLLAPAALVQEAKRRGLRVLGLTDHDTLGGLAEADAEARGLGIDLIPGVELSTDLGRHEAHILGYFVDQDDPNLLAGLDWFARKRRERIDQIVDKLRGLGLRIEPDRVREFAGAGTIGRPHVAHALIEAGYVASVTDAFDRFLASGRPAFVSRQKVAPEEGVSLILKGGGVPVLAHPFSTGGVEGILARLVPAGLLGLETWYGEYDAAEREELRRIAEQWGLIPTGGSDYHGPRFKPGRELGGPPVPYEAVERLRDAAERVKAARR
ncbi:MAG: PHP domain-containing protein [Thermomicrobiales bacterium]